ncbi:hypothetical protein [Flavobacterium palustre]
MEGFMTDNRNIIVIKKTQKKILKSKKTNSYSSKCVLHFRKSS